MTHPDTYPSPTEPSPAVPLCPRLRRRQNRPPTHLPEAGYGVRTVPELPGHPDVETTMIDSHFLSE